MTNFCPPPSILRRGFTLVEVMITITIVSVLVTIGASSYGRARDRQLGAAAGEQILSILNENQKIANVGKHECNGKFLGQAITITPPNTISAQPACELPPTPSPLTSTVEGITFAAPASFTFYPLYAGTNLGGGTELTLTYSSTVGLTYQILLNQAGTIEYLGLTP